MTTTHPRWAQMTTTHSMWGQITATYPMWSQMTATYPICCQIATTWIVWGQMTTPYPMWFHKKDSGAVSKLTWKLTSSTWHSLDPLGDWPFLLPETWKEETDKDFLKCESPLGKMEPWVVNSMSLCLRGRTLTQNCHTSGPPNSKFSCTWKRQIFLWSAIFARNFSNKIEVSKKIYDNAQHY